MVSLVSRYRRARTQSPSPQHGNANTMVENPGRIPSSTSPKMRCRATRPTDLNFSTRVNTPSLAHSPVFLEESEVAKV